MQEVIASVTFRFGPTTESSAFRLPAAAVNVIVGPNNSGKSVMLSEILSYCAKGWAPPDSLIVQSMEFKPLDVSESESALSAVAVEPPPGQFGSAQATWIATPQSGPHGLPVNKQAFVAALQNPNDPQFHQQAAQWFLRSKSLMLNAQNRAAIGQPQPLGDLTKPKTTLQQLFVNDLTRTRLRATVYEAFGLHLLADPTRPVGSVQLTLSKFEPKRGIERSLEPESVAFHQAAQPLQLASDGTKAFIGILAEVMIGDPDILLIDEPEAFLHPTLALRLGKEISNFQSNTRKTVFAATHSVDFLIGCVRSSSSINVVRLTYQAGVPSIRHLLNDDIRILMLDPLLRSSGVLAALFYRNVIVVEGDSDRAFYHEINERLLEADDARAIPDCLFLSAHNKQSIPKILEPLRRLGIATAAIYDIDLIKDGGTVAQSYYHSAFLPAAMYDGWTQQRSRLKSLLERSCKSSDMDMKRNGGVALLDDDGKALAHEFFGQLASFGVFVVSGGELQSWLGHLQVETEKRRWLTRMFERMGNDPLKESYVRAADGDVWEFIGAIKVWLDDPRRKGIPAG